MNQQEKRKQTIIKKYGSYEAYIEQMRKCGSKGGKNGGRPFRDVPNLAKRASKIGLNKRYNKDAG